MNTFRNNLIKERERNEKDLKHLRNREFACEADALEAAKAFANKLRHQRLSFSAVAKEYYAGKGRPKKDAAPEGRRWFVAGTLMDDEAAIRETEGRKGMFVIATNELDESALSDEQLLCASWPLSWL